MLKPKRLPLRTALRNAVFKSAFIAVCFWLPLVINVNAKAIANVITAFGGVG